MSVQLSPHPWFDTVLHVPRLLHVVGRGGTGVHGGWGGGCRVLGDSIQCATTAGSVSIVKAEHVHLL